MVDHDVERYVFHFFCFWGPVNVSIDYSACFSDDTIFPASKRVTAIGICNIVARALTILAPLVNEARVPLPMLSFIAAISIALIFSFSFR